MQRKVVTLLLGMVLLLYSIGAQAAVPPSGLPH